MNWESIIPFAVVFIIILVMLAVIRKNNPTKDQYDERQEMLRKKAYKYSAMTMVFCAIIYFLLTHLLEIELAEDGVSAFLLAMIGIAVFAVYSIFNDAYFGIKNTRGAIGRPVVYVILLLIVVVGNGIGAVKTIQAGEMVHDGRLTSNVMQLSLSILFLLVLISLGLKYLINKKEEREAEE